MSGTKTTDFKPAFQAEHITGDFTRTVMHIEEDVREVGPMRDKKIIARRLVPKVEHFTDGYMVYFPQGHSMFVAGDDVDQLQRIGVLETPSVVDMITGEVVPQEMAMTPKEIVEARTRARYRPKSTGGLATLEGAEIE